MKQQDKIIDHYQDQYFNQYQRTFGEFGGRANKFMFEKHISSEDTVLDFGCGGGFLLKNLNCQERIGVEINPVARAHCNNVEGIRCYPSLDSIADLSVDVIISSHCLEHTTSPFELVGEMFRKLKMFGKIIIVVPLDSYRYRWQPDDVNNHLYSFSPMNLGNILQGAGFRNIQTEVVLHKWIPGYDKVYNLLGPNTFHQLSWLYGRFINKRSVQIKGIGFKTL